MADGARTRLTTGSLLFAFTLLAFLIHGYHYGIEDEAIYLPAIKKILDPTLYPRGSEFFMGQARGTVFPWLIAWLTRFTHAPLPWVVIIAQFVSIYLFLFGCWMIADRCFPTARQRWSAVALITALLTLPIAGTSIYIVDQHLHPRTLASALVLIAIAFALSRHAIACVTCCIAAVLIHPLMTLYGIVFVVVLWLPLERWNNSRRAFYASLLHLNGMTAFGMFAAIPFLARPTAAWREALATREYYTLRGWEWYEWLGLLAPIVIVWWLARVCERRQLTNAGRLLHRLTLYAALMAVVTLVITLPRTTDFLWPLQPFRYLHTVYVLMIIMLAGVSAAKHTWPTAVAAGVLAAIMCAVQFVQYPPAEAHHIDLPGLAARNGYVQAFLWAREHTPKEAYFALDPEYMRYSNAYGFRALGERSQMADISKDGGVVTVAPQLATEWKREVDALRAWREFTVADFARLRRDFGVQWVIVNGTYRPLRRGLDCPFYTSAAPAGAAVCRTPSAPLLSGSASN